MRLFRLSETCSPIILAVGVLLVGCSRSGSPDEHSIETSRTQACQDEKVTGLKLPAGFCATIFADNIGHARHLVVSSEGVVYVNTWSGSYYPAGDVLPPGGFLLALKDQKGTGKADLMERFGESVQDGRKGGTGIALYNGALYAEIDDRIVRYSLSANQVAPQGPPTTIVSKLPISGNHPMHPFIVGEDGFLYIDVGSASNSCQTKEAGIESPGIKPCKELETRAGIWRYDANKPDQSFSAGERYATGIRNAEGFAIDKANHRMFVTQHGRDQLHSLWPRLFAAEQEATLPSEEVLILQKGGDYGWPECYYDPARSSLVLAPEYGGDGGKTIGECANKVGPFAAFPAHWAPLALAWYESAQFPARYQKGLFIAFHGSWNRAPYAQQGYNVVFQALDSAGKPGRCEIFADGFAGAEKSPQKAAHRPAGLAVGPDGSLFIADDMGGRIYKVVYQGDPGKAEDAAFTACPSLTEPAGPVEKVDTTATAGTETNNLPVPAGATAEMVALGSRLYRSEIGTVSCVGCHGGNAKGTPLGPDMTDSTWLWSDGSYSGIAKSITEGVATPKQYRAAMPPLGGNQLTADEVSALAAYVWAMSHSR